jgi:hypothetical protein
MSAEDVHLLEFDENVKMTIKEHEHLYHISPIAASPFRFPSGMNHKFITYESAFEFIAIHCFKIHGKFTKQIARLYLPFSFVYDSKKCEFACLKSIPSQKFLKFFRKVEKTFSKITPPSSQ